MNQPFDPALLRGLTQRRLSRRDALRIGGLGAFTAAFAAACGVKGTGNTNPTPTGSELADRVAAFWKDKVGTGHVEWANWPEYMDPEKPEIKAFTEATGITVNYSEVINDTAEWFATVQPQLAAGNSIGYDLMVITNGAQFQKFVAGGYLAPLDHSKLPRFTANAAPAYKNTSYDPGNVYSIPYASGYTGLAYDPAKTGRPITSLADLKDPAFAGRIGLMGDLQELGNFALWAIGKKPSDSTPDDWRAAAAWLQELKDAGAIRAFYDQDFIAAIEQGDIWISQAWSGDIFQSKVEGSGLEFVIPTEGGTIWTDNFTIPITAANPVDAIALADFFYDPEIAASLASYTGYVTPVPGAKAIIEGWAAEEQDEEQKAYLQEVAGPLVFPTAAEYAKLSSYRDFATPAEEQEYNEIFEPIVLG